MPYTTGSAADMNAVKTALVDACVNDGWLNQTDSAGKTVLEKDDSALFAPMYVRLEVTIDGGYPFLELLGRTSLNAGDAPDVVTIGSFKYNAVDTAIITFPVTYHIFTFINEVFLVIQYEDKYQWLAFGQSNQESLPGTGNWVAASWASDKTPSYSSEDVIKITSSTGGNTYRGDSSAALFWTTDYYNNSDLLSAQNAWVHNGIEGTYPWDLVNRADNGEFAVGPRYLTQLLDTQPNTYNLESVFMPVRAYKKRPQGKVSQICEITNARHIRIDNYSNEQIITMGSEDWMVFPYFKRNTTERDGGDQINHTGTFGWVIKKEN